MKCKDCPACHLVAKERWNNVKRNFERFKIHECWGAQETFEIKDIEHECTEYSKKEQKCMKKKEKNNA
jgi:cytochrome c1